ncbi:AT-rich interactive domain-containing protein 5A [Bagarius yarrelli]|uniref:AT-rich interactive domain-containing protein 5A n=1 Tax=Bagarius yarrelli TaxID=175774 RepID=A0A556V7T1_BAGYA|nr:AT-rich interactive domain-containing protein 5A [Bagarius yarrelli]
MGSVSGALYQGLCIRGSVSWALYNGLCIRGSVSGALYQGLCIMGSVSGMGSGLCIRGSVSWALYQGSVSSGGSVSGLQGSVSGALYIIWACIWALSGAMYHGFCIRGSVSGALYQGLCIMGSVTRALYHGLCIIGSVSCALYQGFCIRGSVSGALYQGLSDRGSVSGALYQGLCIQRSVSGALYQGLCIRSSVSGGSVTGALYQGLCILRSVSGALYPGLCIRGSVSWALYPALCIQRSVSGALYQGLCIWGSVSGALYQGLCIRGSVSWALYHGLCIRGSVTAQQLWKKVYNILGGNPRSTSAATCTRRHYEKLLLPYEFHLAGYGDEIPITLPRQRKRFHPEDEYSQCSKRADFPHLHQFNQYLTPGPITLPSYLAVSLPSVPSLSAPLHSRPMMSYNPSSQVETGNVKQSLEFLRHLAQEYKSSSGWTEPLNLSKKQSRLEATSYIPSSFKSPSVKKKEPKFLNEAPPLQQGNMSGNPLQAAMNQTTRDESDVINLASPCSSSPTVWKVPPSSTLSSPPLSNHPNYPSPVQTKYPTQQNLPVTKSGFSTTSQLSPTPISPTSPLDSYGGMEIQIPLSLLQNLIKKGFIMNSSDQHNLLRSKPSETLSPPEEINTKANTDEPADLSLKNQANNFKKSDISMNASHIAYERQAAESKAFAIKHLQAYEATRFPPHPYVSLKSSQRGFQEQQTHTKQIPSASMMEVGAINSCMMSKKTTDSPALVKLNTTTSSFVQISPEHLKLLFSGSPFRRESENLCQEPQPSFLKL